MIPDTLSPIANHLWQSTLFAALVVLLTLVLRHNRAAIRYALWLAASAKFLIPFSLLVALGGQFQRYIAAVIAPGGLPVTIDQMLAPPVFLAAAGHAMVSTASPIPAVILAVWALGFAAVLFSWWRAWLPIRAALRRATPLRLSVPGLPVFLDVRCSPDQLEPAVIGIWRPVLLLPEGIIDRLQPPEMHAVIAHELCHIRRHDNLAAMMQMLVEALFWFHPLVWWLEARLVDERERACDEAVLRSGNDPAVYAESILKICRFHVHSKLACASGISGADLKKRVEAIMINRVSIRMNAAKKLLLATSAAMVVALPLAVGASNASPSRGAEEVAKEAADPANSTAANPIQLGKWGWASSNDYPRAALREARQGTTGIVGASNASPSRSAEEVAKEAADPANSTAANPIQMGKWGWVSSDDYPRAALREARQGTTGIRIEVDGAGIPTSCKVTSSSGSPDLDEHACAIVVKRARFGAGAPGSTYEKNFRWRLAGA